MVRLHPPNSHPFLDVYSFFLIPQYRKTESERGTCREHPLLVADTVRIFSLARYLSISFLSSSSPYAIKTTIVISKGRDLQRRNPRFGIRTDPRNHWRHLISSWRKYHGGHRSSVFADDDTESEDSDDMDSPGSRSFFSHTFGFPPLPKQLPNGATMEQKPRQFKSKPGSDKAALSYTQSV